MEDFVMCSLSRRLCVVACVAALLAGCGKKDEPFRKVVVPVKGRVTVDGKAPTSPIKIDCHNTGTLDNVHPTVSWCTTGEDGSFALSTYVTGDGVPEGDYALTYFWGEMNLVSMNYGGKDKLKNKYLKPADSPTKFSAKEGKPVDLGEVALTTK
jgi:hypothetical protein